MFADCNHLRRAPYDANFTKAWCDSHSHVCWTRFGRMFRSVVQALPQPQRSHAMTMMTIKMIANLIENRDWSLISLHCCGVPFHCYCALSLLLCAACGAQVPGDVRGDKGYRPYPPSHTWRPEGTLCPVCSHTVLCSKVGGNMRTQERPGGWGWGIFSGNLLCVGHISEALA